MAKILIADAAPESVLLQSGELEDLGYEVVCACGSREVFAGAAADRPDAILLDAATSGAEGLGVCRRLKDDPALASIPVIMITASGQDRDILDALDAGAEDWVAAPPNLRILAACLERVLRSTRSQDAIHQTSVQLGDASRKLDEKSQRLAELSDATHEFIDSVSHEFRAPLSVIREFVSILEDGLAGPLTPEQREYLGIMSNCLDDLMLMVKDMLDLSKLEAGLLSVRRTVCAVEDLIEPVRPVLERKAQSRQIEFSVAVDSGLPAVWADAAQIGRVVSNLVVNAIRFTSDGGHIELWAHADPMAGEVVLGVTDDGPGIDPDRLDVILQWFACAGQGAQARGRGVGLGLSIAKELVALNFGQMSVRSEIGKGSTFALTIPSADPERLFQRYLRHPEFARNRLRRVSLATVRVEDDCPGTAADAVNELLHSVLRSSDMILRVEPRRWVLVLDEDAPHSQAVLERLQKCHQQANQKYPSSPLPPIALAMEGTWQGQTQHDRLLWEFRSACLAGEAAPCLCGR